MWKLCENNLLIINGMLHGTITKELSENPVCPQYIALLKIFQTIYWVNASIF